MPPHDGQKNANAARIASRWNLYTAPQPALMSWPEFQPYKHATDGMHVQYFSIAEDLCKTC